MYVNNMQHPDLRNFNFLSRRRDNGGAADLIVGSRLLAESVLLAVLKFSESAAQQMITSQSYTRH